MEINNIVQQSIQQSNFGSRKVPRYLYHLTDSKSIAQIQQSGKIQRSNFTLGLNFSAVFLFELKNLTKRWGCSRDWSYNNLAKDLFSQCAHGTLSLILIRIPVDKLKKEDLRIRNLNRLFGSNTNNYHVKEGAPATESKLYKARKKAIEYLYPHEIPVDDIEVLGSVENFRHLLRKNGIKGVLSELFQNQPEEKCIKTLQNKR